MKANYPSPILDFTLQEEGGYSNNPKDPGGATMHGITQRTYNFWRVKQGLPERWVYYIEYAELAAIYQQEYWNDINGDALPSGVDLLAFDIAVNTGPVEAATMLARCRGMSTYDTVFSLDRQRRDFWSHLLSMKWAWAGWFSRENAALIEAKRLASIPDSAHY